MKQYSSSNDNNVYKQSVILTRNDYLKKNVVLSVCIILTLFGLTLVIIIAKII
jgi:hypothetical protein